MAGAMTFRSIHLMVIAVLFGRLVKVKCVLSSDEIGKSSVLNAEKVKILLVLLAFLSNYRQIKKKLLE